MKTNHLIFEKSTLITENVGHITQIIGYNLDVTFSPGKMPNIYNALID